MLRSGSVQIKKRRDGRADGDELMINLTTAKALGIEVPMGLMLRADELVE